MKKITALKVLENYRVWLRFNDGAEGQVDFSSKPRTGVFACWNDYENFRQARIGDGGELLWNYQLDFCPDSLWLQMTGEKPEALLAQLNAATGSGKCRGKAPPKPPLLCLPDMAGRTFIRTAETGQRMPVVRAEDGRKTAQY